MNKKTDEYRETGAGPSGAGGGGDGISLGGLRTFSSFRNYAFRLYFLGMTGQWFSMSVQMVTRSLLIYRISGSGTVLGLSALAHAIPMLLLSLFGGAIADRVRKKYILFYTQIASMVLTLGIALSLTLGYLSVERPGSWWILVASAALQGTIMGFMMPSRQAIIPEIIGDEQVMNAVSLNNMGMNVFQLASPALAGFLIDAFDFDFVYYVTTVVYAISTICIGLMPHSTAKITHGRSAIKDIMDGLRYIGRQKIIMLVLMFTLFGIICRMPFMLLMPMFTEDILRVEASGMGLLMSITGFGAIAGSIILASLPNRKRGLMMLLSGLLQGLALIAFSFSHWLYFSLAIVIFVGLGQTGQMTLGNTLVQNYSDAEYRGRVMSFLMMGFGFSSLFTFFAGVMAEAVGVQWTIGSLAIILVLVSIVMLTSVPQLRKLD